MIWIVEQKIEAAQCCYGTTVATLSSLPQGFFIPEKNRPLGCLLFFFSIPCAFKLPYLTLWLYIGSNCHLLVICFWTRWSKKELIQLKNRAKYMKQLFKTLCIIAKLILVHYLCKIMDMEVQGRWRLFGNTWKLLHKCPEQRTRGN